MPDINSIEFAEGDIPILEKYWPNCDVKEKVFELVSSDQSLDKLNEISDKNVKDIVGKIWLGISLENIAVHRDKYGSGF